MVAKAITQPIKQYLSAVNALGYKVAYGIVFGSYGRGDSKPESDIDLLVISPKFDEEYDFETVAKLWRLAARIDCRIEPIPCGVQEWRLGSDNPIVEVARQEGAKVTVIN